MENCFHAFHTGESGPRFPVFKRLVWSVLVSPDKRASYHHHTWVVSIFYTDWSVGGQLSDVSILKIACLSVAVSSFSGSLGLFMPRHAANFVSVAASLHWFSFSRVACEKPEKKRSESLKTLLWHWTQTEPWSTLIWTKTASFVWDQGLAVWFWPGPEVLHQSF